MCLVQAKDKLAPTKDAVQGGGLATIIVYRQWSFSGAGRPSWKFNVDNGPDLIVRNGTYLRLDLAPGDHVLDHKHEFLFGSDPQITRCQPTYCEGLFRTKKVIHNLAGGIPTKASATRVFHVIQVFAHDHSRRF